MTDAITNAIVELARYAVIAYAVKNGRDVMIHWLNATPQTQTAAQIVDAARAHGLEVRE